MDKLEFIFKKQEELCNRITCEHHIKDHLGHTLQMETIRNQAQALNLGVNDLPCRWVRTYLDCIIKEVEEAKEMLPWKFWAKDMIGEKAFPHLTPEQRLNMLRVELVDILHFLVDAMLVAGMTAGDAYLLYVQKNQVNFNRQDQGYKDAGKTEVDNEEIIR
jgi:hypothetical protein